MKNRLIKKRNELNLTQSELGKIANISQSMISKVENGERSLDDNSKIRLAKALGVGVGWLFFNENYDVMP